MAEPPITTPVPHIADDAVADVGDRFQGRFEARDGVRHEVARGTIINAVFLVGMSVLGFVKGFIVAAFLTTEEYGIWGILAVSLGTLTWLAQTGVGSKYVQQDEDDQELAFQKAFTLELASAAIFTVLLLAAVPLFAMLYGRSEILAAGAVSTLALMAIAFTAPVWVYYRRMRFFRQRMLLSADPIVSFVVTVALAANGAGYWSFVIGILAGQWSAAAAAVAFSPYPLRLRYARGTMREYLSFSWPLVIYGASGVVIAQVSTIVGEWQLGVGAIGVIALTSTIVQLTDRVDQMVTGSLYPAICAVKDRTDLLFESFVKSNRLTLMWGVPFGVGVSLFADDLVSYGIGEQWRAAVPLLQVFGVIAAVNHVGFNWDAFYRARGNTRPIAVVSLTVAGVFLVTAVPGMIVWGLDGFAAGMAAITLVALAGRGMYLTRMFPGFKIARHLVRALGPTVPAVAVVLAARALVPADRGLGIALLELALYLLVTVVATVLLERPLLREVTGYLFRSTPSTAGSPAPTGR